MSLLNVNRSSDQTYVILTINTCDYSEFKTWWQNLVKCSIDDSRIDEDVHNEFDKIDEYDRNRSKWNHDFCEEYTIDDALYKELKLDWCKIQ